MDMRDLLSSSPEPIIFEGAQVQEFAELVSHMRWLSWSGDFVEANHDEIARFVATIAAARRIVGTKRCGGGGNIGYAMGRRWDYES